VAVDEDFNDEDVARNKVGEALGLGDDVISIRCEYMSCEVAVPRRPPDQGARLMSIGFRSAGSRVQAMEEKQLDGLRDDRPRTRLVTGSWSVWHPRRTSGQHRRDTGDVD